MHFERKVLAISNEVVPVQTAYLKRLTRVYYLCSMFRERWMVR